MVLDDHDLIYSLAALGTEKVIAGCRDGALCVFGLHPASGADGRLHTARCPNVWSPVVDVACSRGKVAALHDATFAMDPGGEHRNILRLWDPERQVLCPEPRSRRPRLCLKTITANACRDAFAVQVELGAVSEFMESYELIAFAFADEAAGGHEIIAGAVHGG